MQINGLPYKFWVVTKPSPISTIGDICFQTDFAGFVQQVRGGLHEHDVAGIFAEEQPAKAVAESLLQAKDQQKQYTYYVGTLSRYILAEASNARGALEAGERHPDLDGSEILTVRIATKDETEQAGWHADMIEGEQAE